MSAQSRYHSLPLLLVVPIFLSLTGHAFAAQAGEVKVQVHGTVSMVTDAPAGITGVRVSFVASDGTVEEATTNKRGEYELLLKPEVLYTVAVISGPTCELHRPEFRPVSGSIIEFDFLIPSEITYVDW